MNSRGRSRSVFSPYRPSTAYSMVFSTYGGADGISGRSPRAIWEYDPFVYRVNDGHGLTAQNPMTILHEVFGERGWKEYGIEEQRLIKGNVMGWNLCWRTNFSTIIPKSLFTWQFTNNIPKAIGFCNKEYLARYTTCMLEVYGSIFDFSPATFILPRDYFRLDIEHSRRAELAKNSDMDFFERARNLVPTPGTGDGDRRNFKPVWISKPIGKSQGRGIVVLDDVSGLTITDTPTVVQEYIARPLLIGGHKFDLRIYVCVASAFPLTIYVYNEGLTRFATEKYDLTNLGNTYSHLTNASINKFSPEYEKDKELIGHGCKWNFRRLRQYLEHNEQADWYMWQRIISIIVLTLIGEANRGGFVPHTKNCFEFLGYDVLLDEDLRPWLLEANHCPGLNADCEVDYEVKNAMLHDLFNLLGLPNLSKKPGTPAERCASAPRPERPETPRAPRPCTEFPLTVYNLDIPAVEKAMAYLKGKKGKLQPGSMRSRLIDLTAIYSQPLFTDPSILPRKRKPVPKKVLPKKPPPVDESISSKEKRGFKHRDWTKPLKQCGGWVRVFPFDEITNEQCRGRLGFDVKLIVNRIYCNLKAARQLTKDKPGHTDEFYGTALKRLSKLNSEVWLPPV